MPLCTLETSEKSFASTSRSRENRLSRPEDTLAVEPSLRLLPIGAAAAAPAGGGGGGGAGGSSSAWISPPNARGCILGCTGGKPAQRPFRRRARGPPGRQRCLARLRRLPFALAVVVVGRRQSWNCFRSSSASCELFVTDPRAAMLSRMDFDPVPRTRAVIPFSRCLRPATPRHRPLRTRRRLTEVAVGGSLFCRPFPTLVESSPTSTAPPGIGCENVPFGCPGWAADPWSEPPMGRTSLARRSEVCSTIEKVTNNDPAAGAVKLAVPSGSFCN